MRCDPPPDIVHAPGKVQLLPYIPTRCTAQLPHCGWRAKYQLLIIIIIIIVLLTLTMQTHCRDSLTEYRFQQHLYLPTYLPVRTGQAHLLPAYLVDLQVDGHLLLE